MGGDDRRVLLRYSVIPTEGIEGICRGRRGNLGRRPLQEGRSTGTVLDGPPHPPAHKAESIKNILDLYVLDAFSHVCRRDHKSYGSFCVQSRSTIPKVNLGRGKRQRRVVIYNDALENSDSDDIYAPEGFLSSSS